jgi:hypothetical protein
MRHALHVPRQGVTSLYASVLGSRLNEYGRIIEGHSFAGRQRYDQLERKCFEEARCTYDNSRASFVWFSRTRQCVTPIHSHDLTGLHDSFIPGKKAEGSSPQSGCLRRCVATRSALARILSSRTWVAHCSRMSRASAEAPAASCVGADSASIRRASGLSRTDKISLAIRILYYGRRITTRRRSGSRS